MPKWSIWRVFENLKRAVKQCYQTGHFLIGQKLVENTQNQKLKCDILSHFEAMWMTFYFVLKPEVSLWLPHLQLESRKSRCYLMVPP